MNIDNATWDKLMAEVRQMKRELDQVKKERNAAVSDLKYVIFDSQSDYCSLCKYYDDCDEDGYCRQECNSNVLGWEWHGVKGGENGSDQA